MGTAMYDALDDMQTLLKDKWGSSSNAGSFPEVEIVWERKVVGLADYTRDTILVSPKRENVEYFGLYGSDFLHHVEFFSFSAHPLHRKYYFTVLRHEWYHDTFL